MYRKRRRPSGSNASAALLAAVLTIAFFVSVPASAFELFGIHLWGPKDEPEETAEPVPDPVSYTATLTVGDEDLQKRMDSISLLVSKQDQPVSGTIGLLTRAKNDKKRLVAALFSEARYGGTVNISINGTLFEQVPIDADLRNRQNTVRIQVTQGPLFTFAAPRASTSGGQRIDMAQYGIVAGEPAKSEMIVAAEGKLIRAWRDKGYAFAKIGNREVIADHAMRKLEVDLTLNTGPLASFGSVTVRGEKDIDPGFIVQQADIPTGQVFRPKRIKDASDRLRALGVFDSVVVSEAKSPGPGGTVPITIEVSERKKRTFGVGLTAATDDGLGAEGFWLHRNLFGRAESLRLEGSVNGIGRGNFNSSFDYLIAATFTKPGIWGPTTNFVSRLEAQYQDTDAFRKESIGGSVGLTRKFNDQLDGEIALTVEYAEYEDALGPSRSLLISLPVQVIQDTRDNTLDPTKGYRLLMAVEPSYDAQNSNSFVKVEGAFSTYWAVNPEKTVVLAGKIAAGSIYGANLLQVPPDRRFYAGGGGSIRGYGYQLASPRRGDDLIGGLSIVEASFETRYKLTDTIGLAAFIDTGGAFTTSTPGENGTWYTGVGGGVRYLSPVGPLRLDVGIPLKKIEGDPDFGVYLGLGQAF